MTNTLKIAVEELSKRPEEVQERGITDALMADRHFEQAGVNALLK